MTKDINRSVQDLRDDYFCLDKNLQNKINNFIKQLPSQQITTVQLQQMLQQHLNKEISQNSIKYAMLLNNFIPEDMHKTEWKFIIN